MASTYITHIEHHHIVGHMSPITVIWGGGSQLRSPPGHVEELTPTLSPVTGLLATTRYNGNGSQSPTVIQSGRRFGRKGHTATVVIQVIRTRLLGIGQGNVPTGRGAPVTRHTKAWGVLCGVKGQAGKVTVSAVWGVG